MTERRVNRDDNRNHAQRNLSFGIWQMYLKLVSWQVGVCYLLLVVERFMPEENFEDTHESPSRNRT